MLFELLPIFFNVIAPVFLIVLLGYAAARPLQLEARTLSRFAYYFLVPSFVFDILSKAAVEAGLLGRMVVFIMLVQLAVTALGYTVARLLGHKGKMVGAFMLIAVFANVGNFGLPLITFHLGEEALVEATVYFVAILAISFVIGVGSASWAGGNSLTAVTSIVKTPALLALLPALLSNGLDWSPPLLVVRVTALLGAAMVPTMLVALGVQLAGMTELGLNRDVIAASMVRLLGGPLLALLLVGPFDLSGNARAAGILQAGMPAAVLCAIIALEYDLEPNFVTRTVLFSTLASVVTLTLLLAIS